jgi:NAD(P)-dependent dehydrogenase (short-subunit alcohol dehydrogenase family)
MASHAFDLSGKMALITGSTRGIGAAIARQMAVHGARVVVSSRKAEACQAVAADISVHAGAGAAVPIPCHIGHKDQLEELVHRTQSQLGSIDILVCNAAVNPFFGSMAEIPDSALDKVLDCNIKANHWLCQLVLPEMRRRRQGVIIIISSIGGLYGHSTLGTYSISKAADMQLARNIAAEFGPHDIRANAIAPGLIKTDFSKALWEDGDSLSAATDRIALRRIGEAEDIASVAVFLASDAARYITGQTLVVDGGMMGL